jgi:pimeloyl-ACP methyl ester carboxylesterase
MKRIITAGVLAAAFLVGGCGSGGNGTIGAPDLTLLNGNPGGSTPPAQPTSSTALFQPAAGVLPYPTDLYFAGSTDGTLNIQPANALLPNQAAVNALDGFSTTAVIRERFGGALNPASFTAASVIVVPVTTDNETKATTGVLGAPLAIGTDFTAALATDALVGATILEITPRHPLMPSTCISNGAFLGANCKTGTGYLVILTNGITDTSGNPAVPDVDYAAIKSALAGGPTCPSITDPTLNGICQLTGAHLQIAQALHLNPANIVLTFSFTTESTSDTLELLSATSRPSTIKLNATGITTSQADPALQGHANIYVGVLTIPYYLSKSAPLTGSWQAPPFPLDPSSTFVTRFNPLPVATQNLLIPVMVTVPNAASTFGATPPAGGWPVLIFQHGITRNREDMLAVADSFADAGFVVAAIDLPLHGITTPYNVANPATYFYASSANPFYAGLGLPATGSIERTFDLDLITPGVIDPSGTYFINLKSPLTFRDNLREGAADLITLARTLPSMSLGAAGGVNATAIHFLGHSLGGIVGGTLMAVVGPGISTATLANPGGGIAQLGEDSPSFAPEINAALAAQGLTPGTTLYAQFFRDGQTVIDSGDPINFIALATAQHPIHVLQVVGTTPPPANCGPSNQQNGCPDQVVPNSSTERLITASAYGPAGAAGALTGIPAPAAPGPLVNASGFRAYVNFVAGAHGSIIDPTPSLFVTEEMQGEAVSFAASNGQEILISIPSVIQP